MYDSWGKVVGTTGSLADTIGATNPFRYRGYYYDAETGLYYLNSRYYDPEVGRFINADGYVSTGQDILGNNMFAYCGNNPVNRADPSGMFWKEIGNFFKGVGTAIANFAKATFGAGATTVHQIKQETELVPPVVNMFVTVKTGTKESKTVSKKGNSSKPISVYAQGRSDNYALSSAGININIASFTLDISLGLDDIGISGSIKNGDTTNAFGISADISQFKVGFEASSTVKWDESTDVTSYTNASITGWGIAAVYIFATTGQWVSSPQQQPAFG